MKIWKSDALPWRVTILVYSDCEIYAEGKKESKKNKRKKKGGQHKIEENTDMTHPFLFLLRL